MGEGGHGLFTSQVGRGFWEDPGWDDLTAELTVGHTRKGIAAVYDLQGCN